MKKFIRLFIILFISVILVLFGAAFSHSNFAQSGNTGADLFFQATSTPLPQPDKSEVGSTDGITILSFMITALIVVPIYLQRRHWSQS
jgi:hypothetical protein